MYGFFQLYFSLILISQLIAIWSEMVAYLIQCFEISGATLSQSSGSHREGNGTPLQYSCLENPMGGGAWWVAVQGSDTTEQLPFHFSLSCTGEGNGNPLQCSCLENPRDGGAWRAAVYGITQSRTRLKRLSSSSSGSQPGLNIRTTLVDFSPGSQDIRHSNYITMPGVICFYNETPQ